MSTIFTDERGFEDRVVAALQAKGWSDGLLEYPDEQALINNWKDILFENNRGIDQLDGCPLTDGEMGQILNAITSLKTPADINTFINGRSVSIVRDNPDDEAHLGKLVTLRIYDRNEIAGGKSRYQIVRQPRFNISDDIYPRRRGDLMLLINGMPVIHIELKRTGVAVNRAVEQIRKYSHEGVFRKNLFSMVQIFVAMNPEETVYFANPGSSDKFNADFQFHWADRRNVRIDRWNEVVERLLSIPMAHTMIGFYTVADAGDGVLKVMRSYQYYAADAILAKVTAAGAWDGGRIPRGGYIWHTTGSGKTLTSFKTAQLISASKCADKVVFLLDRIELSTQSFENYKAFATEYEEIHDTEDTRELVSLLKSDNPGDCLIVTSIQKMGLVGKDRQYASAETLEHINSKRLVFVVDECHRSSFGENMAYIKSAFPRVLLFGFTGTPIKAENKKKGATTADVFGDELHSYTLANGIVDGNVLGFDKVPVATYTDDDLRLEVALHEAHAESVEDALDGGAKERKFLHWMHEVPMASEEGESIEGKIPRSMYDCDEHREAVVEDIKNTWVFTSHNRELHGILATSSIPEAIKYYRLMKNRLPDLNVTALFDTNDGGEFEEFREDGVKEIIEDYNEKYGQGFTFSTHPSMKKDISRRLAHKGQYRGIDKNNQIDILIVVHQMLTGFDSAWLGVLYLDKTPEYENIIQAFSRTNRKFPKPGVKPHGIIRYYRKHNTMTANIEKAVALYSDGQTPGLFVDKLDFYVEGMNARFASIKAVFKAAGFPDFSANPADVESQAKFADDFKTLNEFLESAKTQGFSFDEDTYTVEKEDGTKVTVVCQLDEYTWRILMLRYSELFARGLGGSGNGGEEPPYDIDAHLVVMVSERIDAEYMQSRFLAWMRAIERDEPSDVVEEALNELHNRFATLSQEDQKYANRAIREIQDGVVEIDETKTIFDYIAMYRKGTMDGYLSELVAAFGLDEAKLRRLTEAGLSENDLTRHGWFDELRDSIDFDKAKAWFDAHAKKDVKMRIVRRETDRLLREFIPAGGLDIEEWIKNLQ